MFIRKYGAIDIGSNGVRLLISNIVEFDENQTEFKKSALIRVPIRLGEDVFNTGKISEKNIQRMSDAMNSFRLIMSVYGVEKFKACATSAMREATNGKNAIKKIFENSQIKIEIIDGEQEAEIISYTELHTLLKSNRSYLYVDVGGGSTEFTFFSKGKKINSMSFPLGTVRILDGKVEDSTWSEAEEWIRENSSPLKNLSLIGSGGNINKLYKMSGKPPGKYLDIKYLENYFNFLNNMTYEERISKLDLNPDRADVIVPAAKIYLYSMQWSGASKIYVPKFGLSDGIIRGLYANKLR